ncbi:MAG: transcriptional regulator [Thermotogae bacterium]|nr:transcriptional regulator [Thermotogota bacterium]
MIGDLDPTIHNRVRLGILTLLLKNGRMDFGSLRDTLEITDGNLASHLRTLEREGLVRYEKTFIGRRPRTYYTLTPEGRRRLRRYLKALRSLLEEIEGEDPKL